MYADDVQVLLLMFATVVCCWYAYLDHVHTNSIQQWQTSVVLPAHHQRTYTVYAIDVCC